MLEEKRGCLSFYFLESLFLSQFLPSAEAKSFCYVEAAGARYSPCVIAYLEILKFSNSAVLMGVIFPWVEPVFPWMRNTSFPAGLWCLSLDSLLPAKKVHQMGVGVRQGARLGVFLFCLCFVEWTFLPCACFVFCQMSLWECLALCTCSFVGHWGTVLLLKDQAGLVLGSETLWDKEGWSPAVQPDSCYLIGNWGDTFHWYIPLFPSAATVKKHSKKKKNSLFFPGLWTDVCFRHCLIVLLKNRHWFFGFSWTLLFLCLGLFLLLCQLSWRMTLLTEPWKCINLGSRDWILSLWYILWIWIVFFRNLNWYWTK